MSSPGKTGCRPKSCERNDQRENLAAPPLCPRVAGIFSLSVNDLALNLPTVFGLAAPLLNNRVASARDHLVVACQCFRIRDWTTCQLLDRLFFNDLPLLLRGIR